MTVKTDTYNYDQNPLGGGQYTTVVGGGIISTAGGAFGQSAADPCASMWALSNYTFLNDQTSEVTLGNTVAFDDPGAGVRMDPTGSGRGYITFYDQNAISVFVMSGGTYGSSILNVFSITLVSGDKLKIGVVGTTISVYKNGVLAGSVTDTTFSSGQPGPVYAWDNVGASIITAWTGTDGGSSGGSTIVPYKPPPIYIFS